MPRSTQAFWTRIAVAMLLAGGGASSSWSASAAAIASTGTPAGFEELARPREIFVDVHFGGQKVGEALAVVRPGFLEFRDPQRLAALVPNAIDTAQLATAFTGELQTNSALVCGQASSANCGILMPKSVGIIFDEEHFRVDLFVSSNLLRAANAPSSPYLPTPSAVPSLTSSMGLAISGTTGSSTLYNVQNRTILAAGNIRIRSDTSFASRLGLLADDLVAEVDRPDLRYSAGLFWAPGLDITGQRRIVGIGVGTQFDTRTDRDLLRGTPLVVFLNQPARVEILMDGRLVGSGLYNAGNNVLDTSTLPDGAYSLLLRIREAGGNVREERRFLVKNAQIAPVSKPLYFAYAGMLADTRRNRLISLSRNFYYQFGSARRLNRSLAVDVSAIGTQKKTMVEAGAWLINHYARVRLAALVSTTGDRAALFQLGSAGFDNLSLNFDVRRVWSNDGSALIPAPSYVADFASGSPVKAQLGNGSYTQGTASLGYQLGSALVSVIASYRKDRSVRSDYSVGPSLQWLLLNRNGIQLSFQADAQRTRSSTSGFVGFRILRTAGGFSTIGTSGYRRIRTRDGGDESSSRAVTSISTQYFHEDENQTQLSLDGGFERGTDVTSAHATGTVYSRLGSARADLLYNFANGRALQYGLSIQTGAALGPGAVSLGGRELQESAVVASLEGAAPGAKFQVLVDDQFRGLVKASERLPIFLQPYHRYKVRLRPVGEASVWYDSVVREVTLYPGTVQHLSWRVEPELTLFGQAVRANGAPVANARVQSRRGVGESDGLGYFQIDASGREPLVFTSADGGSCRMELPEVRAEGAYSSLGKVLCQ
jgi:hypothetical protein